MPVYCKNCNSGLQGNFCHNCGQKKINPEHRTLKHLFEEFFHYFTHLDSKVIRTIKTLLTKPGQITKDVINGITVKHFKLSSLFLIATLIYFLLRNNFYGFMNTPFNGQINSGIGSDLKRYIVEQKMMHTGVTKEVIATAYNQKLTNYGKLVTLFLIPLTIPALWIINLIVKLFKKGHRFKAYDLGMASLEINTMLVIVLFVFGGITNELIFLVAGNTIVNAIITGIIFMAVAFLLLLFIKRLFEIKWWQAIVCLLLFLGLYAFVIDLFRLVSFLVLI